MNQPPAPPAPAAKNPPPANAAPPAEAPKPSAEEKPPAPAGPSKLERAQQAIAKAEESAKRFREEQSRRQNAERLANQERQRAAELQQREAARQKEAAEQEARAKRLAADEQLAKDPEGYLKSHTERLLNLEDALAREKARNDALERHLAQQAQSARIEAANREFVKAASDEKKYPNLATVSEAVILPAAHQLAKAHGWGDDEILEYLENQLAGHPKKASKTPEKKPAENHQAAAAPKQADTPRAISSSMSKGFTMPDNFDKLPDREKKKILAQKYKAEVEAKAAAKG